MSILQLPGQPPQSEPVSMIREEHMPDGSVRLVHTCTQPNGQSAFVAFLSDGTFQLRDAHGSFIMSNAGGDMLISPARALVLSGLEALLRDAANGNAVSLHTIVEMIMGTAECQTNPSSESTTSASEPSPAP